MKAPGEGRPAEVMGRLARRAPYSACHLADLNGGRTLAVPTNYVRSIDAVVG
jgi:hypothetical protein